MHVCCPRVFSSIAYNWMEYHALSIGVQCTRAPTPALLRTYWDIYMYLSRVEQFMKPSAYGRCSNFSGLKISTFQTFRDNLDWNLHFWMKHQCAEMLIFPGTGAIWAIWAWVLSQVFLSQAKTTDILIWYARKGFPRFSPVLTNLFLHTLPEFPTGIWTQ